MLLYVRTTHVTANDGQSEYQELLIKNKTTTCNKLNYSILARI